MTTLSNFNHSIQPAGAVTLFAGGIIQSGEPDIGTTPIEAADWMVCDGRFLNREQYPELYVALGYTYGAEGDSFAIPNLADVPAGGSNTLKYIIKFTV